jgi:hypothetical protein
MISADTTNVTGSFLNIVSNLGLGGAQIQLTDTTGETANTAITLQYEGSGNGLLQFIGPNSIIALTTDAPGGAGQLVIGKGDGGGATITKNVIIDVSNNNITLGDPVVAIGTSPTVTVNTSLVALQPVTVQGAAPGTGMFLNATGAVPTIFASGALQVGTVTHTNLLTVADAPTPNVGIAGALGVGGAVSVLGTVGATGDIVSSAGNVEGLNVQVASGGAVSSSATVAGGGVLNIKNASDTAPPQITLSNANTTINGLILVPGSLSFQGVGSITAFRTLATNSVVCGDNTTVSIPNPSGIPTGLFMVLGRGSGAQAGQPACSVSTISYYNGATWSWGGGSCCPALVTAPPSFIGIQGAGATLLLANGGGIGSVQMDFIYLQLGGSLGI